MAIKPVKVVQLDKTSFGLMQNKMNDENVLLFAASVIAVGYFFKDYTTFQLKMIF